jgi:hypothetical protein
MAKKIITVSPKGFTERVQGSGPIISPLVTAVTSSITL